MLTGLKGVLQKDKVLMDWVLDKALMGAMFMAISVGILMTASQVSVAGDKPAASDSKPIQIEAGEQTYQPYAGDTEFLGDVKVALNDMQINGPQAQFKMDAKGNADTAVFNNRATLTQKTGSGEKTIQADTLNMGLKKQDVNAQGKVTTNINGTGKSDNVSIQSDNQIFDQTNHMMHAIGHVLVKKDDMVANSPEAIVFLADSGGAEKVVFIKGAALTRTDQVMKAQTITIKLDTGDIYSETNSESIVSAKDSLGKPTTVKVKSDLQELDKASGTILANGNAVVDFDDYIAKGPKATFYQKDNTLDRIVMTGRAIIDDPQRHVVGDVVTITINPKQFNAEGNVNTFIKANNGKSSDTSTTTTAKPTKQTGKKAAKGGKKSAKGKASQSTAAAPAAAVTSTSASKPSPSNASNAQSNNSSSSGANSSAVQQELMMERVTQDAQKDTQKAPSK